MDTNLPPEFLALGGIAATLGLAAFWQWRDASRLRYRLQEAAETLAVRSARIESLEVSLEQATTLRKETQEEAEKRATTLREELSVIRQKREEALNARADAEKQAELMRQRLEDQQKRMADWEKQREESIKAASAAILKAGGEMSSKLLEDHRREVETARKESEEQTKKTTEHLTKTFETVTQSVSALTAQRSEDHARLETVYRALSTPSEVGQYAEIGLENLLHSFGLEPERDFITQFHTSSEDGSNLRPDAIVFLPDDTVMVIDCKASRFLLDLAEVEGTPEEQATLERLNKTMQGHLRGLARKDYRTAVQNELKRSGRRTQIRQLFSIMYLPTEAALEKIRRADPDFATKARQSDVTLAGPATLAGILGFASMKLSLARQAENQEKIIESTRHLIDGIITIMQYAEKVGRGLKQAHTAFDNFARSTNSRLLPRARTLINLGVEPTRNKKLPGHLPVSGEDAHLIDAEAETGEDSPAEKNKIVSLPKVDS